MKTAISIPDPIFKKADREAKRLGMTRSRYYSEALQAFMQKQSDDAITARLNEVYSQVDSSLDPALRSHAIKKLREIEW